MTLAAYLASFILGVSNWQSSSSKMAQIALLSIAADIARKFEHNHAIYGIAKCG